MSLQYILDGYNVLYALSEIPAGSWQAKRQALLNKLVADRPHGRNALIIVFDSREGMGDRGRANGIDVVFTAGETADEWISQHVRQAPNPRVIDSGEGLPDS